MGKQQESKQNANNAAEPQRGVEQSAPMGAHEAEMQRRAIAAEEREYEERTGQDPISGNPQAGSAYPTIDLDAWDSHDARQAARKKEQRRDKREMMAAHIFANIIKGQEKATKQIARDCVKHAEELLDALDEYNAAEDKAG